MLIGLGGGVQSAIAPGAPVRLAMRLGFKPKGRWAPLLFAEGAYLLPVSERAVEFSDLITGRAGVSIELLRTAQWSAGPEIGFEMGNIEASGDVSLLVNPNVDRSLWMASELGGYGRWVYLPDLFLELGAGLVVPLVRRDYLYRPRSPAAEPVVVWSIPSAGFTAMGRIGLFL